MSRSRVRTAMPSDPSSLYGQSEHDPMEPFPMQDGPPIPWFLAEAIYKHLYRYGGQSLETLGKRGGFGWAEVKAMWCDYRRTTAKHRADCAADARAGMTT
jgi:hypothetical protein